MVITIKSNVESVFGKYIKFQRMVIKDDWKLIYYPKLDKMRLVNLEKDPHEMNDLIDNPEYSSKVSELKKEYNKLADQMKEEIKIK